MKLGYVGEFFMGGTPSRKNLNYWQGGNIKWLTIGDYENFSIITDTKEKITDLGLQNSSAKLIKKGVVVVSIYATIGRVGILGDDMATNQAIVSICVNNNFINKFVMYMIGFCNSQLINMAKTTTQQNINLEILKSIFIPLPPLEAQEKIVKAIEFCEDKILNLNNELKTLENATSKILKRELF
ncbi:restriction endonuclease subunit S [Campylobacter fetus]|uniref:restriction endonuclease subunit S n=1 Tax=Campylobacter fetus TaxID=196 RepID=UPI00163BBF89|nr:restriction endonuclease subunit S [Campylobacter fetus]